MRVGGCILDLRFLEESWKDFAQGIPLDGAFFMHFRYVNCFFSSKDCVLSPLFWFAHDRFVLNKKEKKFFAFRSPGTDNQEETSLQSKSAM